MIDIAEFLKARDSEFVSLRELVTRIRLQQPHITESQIADFLYLEEVGGEMPEWIQQGIAGTIVPTDTDNDYDGDPSLVSLLKIIREEGYMPEVTPPEEPLEFTDDIPF
ncbi:hypothetical protein [Rosenbergiella australiborealis]|uniref:hypothetical protein n=1 Tax=Rosenbergiella australiborealis TaxID=1544696 RepID=UPI001F4D62B1|nr:hypothetical protein [Rosenbergiella australiborealis]